MLFQFCYFCVNYVCNAQNIFVLTNAECLQENGWRVIKDRQVVWQVVWQRAEYQTVCVTGFVIKGKTSDRSVFPIIHILQIKIVTQSISHSVTHSPDYNKLLQAAMKVKALCGLENDEWQISEVSGTDLINGVTSSKLQHRFGICQSSHKVNVVIEQFVPFIFCKFYSSFNYFSVGKKKKETRQVQRVMKIHQIYHENRVLKYVKL